MLVDSDHELFTHIFIYKGCVFIAVAGMIKVKSEVGEGATSQVYLPMISDEGRCYGHLACCTAGD